MDLKLFNSLTKKKETFKPIKKGNVGLYTCGPTVYNYAHIGNLRSYIFADILRRTLEYNNFKVKQVMNITDVGHLTGDRDMGEDKIEKQAREEKKTAWEISDFFTKTFFKDIEKLNILPAKKITKATDTIKEQIKLVEKLEKKDLTYKISDGVYFDTSKLKDYGKLAGLDINGLQEGARVEKNNEKKSPTDFALWKFSYPKGRSFDKTRDDAALRRHMEWPSPWGLGFPGWHIECSAISTKHLGQPFDIHTGGIDHIPVHHTNEIAQSEAAYGKPLANTWMHGEFLIIDKKRMGKSEGNLLTLKTIEDKDFSPLAYRYFVLGAHYRSKLNFSWEAIKGAQNALNNLYNYVADFEKPKIGCAEYEENFLKAINNDLDVPKALALMWDLIKSDYPSHAKKQTLLKFDEVLGLGLNKVKKQKLVVPGDVQKLVDERENARKSRNFKLSDELRKKIEEIGFSIEDTNNGPELKKIK
jgi:cysteinyl-tRNA synthetase